MSTIVTGPVCATVPATSANLGPGYDALGLALGLRDRVTARLADGPEELTVTGEGAGTVPLDHTNLVHLSMRRAFEQMGCDTPPLRLSCENVIPHGRGLGSSSAAIVAGICLARGLVTGGLRLMDDDSVFALAADIEGHPDNVAAAFYGGFTIAYADGPRSRAISVALDPRISAVAFVPPDSVQTSMARALLPPVVPHADAASNAGRTALLVAALSGRPELLFAATEDRLHQDYREPVMPRTLALMRALRAEGLPAVVSGAGPTVLVLTDDSMQPEVAASVPDGWRTLELSLETTGVRLDR